MTAHIGPLRFGKWDLSDRKRREAPGYVLGRLVWWAAVAVTVVLVLGVALTWGNTNPSNSIVHGVMRAGHWLAAPFGNVFHDANARERLTENRLLAASVYLTGGGLLSWIIGR